MKNKATEAIIKTVMWLILLTPILGITVLIIADLLSDEDEGW